jgi:predicted nucleic acid-binding Zn ribbon protein
MNNVIKSLALIKVTLDQHSMIHDYLDIFVPFLITLIKKKGINDLHDVQSICEAFHEEYGLKVPHHPMQTILNKLLALGYATEVTKGRFVPVVDKVNANDFSRLSSEYETVYDNLVEKYILFSFKKHGIGIDKNDATNHFIQLLQDRDVDIMFAIENGGSILPPVERSTVDLNLLYDFLRTTYVSDPETFKQFADICFGYIVASSLLFNYGKSQDPFSNNVDYYLDTGILFGLSGINGEYEKSVYDEFCKLLTSTNGKIKVFEHTVDEFLNIIESCKAWIDNPLYDPLKANQAIMHFRSVGFHASDIDLFIHRFPQLLKMHNIEIVEKPDPNMKIFLQIDECDFQNTLIDIYRENNPYFDEEEKEETIYLDVQSVSAVYKLRGGALPRTLDNCKAIFVTRNSALAYASKLFENSINSDKHFYIPVTVTDVFVGTILWLSSPISEKIQDVFSKRLIANSYAALQPTKQLKMLFLAEVTKAESDKLLSPDDLVVLRTSNVAMGLLQEATLGDKSKITSQTPIEIMNKIRARERALAKQVYEKERLILKEQNAIKEIALVEKEEELAKRTNELNASLAEKRELVNKITGKVKKQANRTAWGIFAILALIVIFVFLQDEGIIHISINPKVFQWINYIAKGLGLLSLFFNINLVGTKDWFLNKIIQRELRTFNLDSNNIS